MQWRIWDYDGTTLRLISDKPTTTRLYLKGENGYNNGVWAMNEVCRQCYTDKSIAGVVEVRNLRRSDIEKVSNYDYTKNMHQLGGGIEVTDEETEEKVIHFGETAEYKESYQSPELWDNYDSKWNYNYDKDTQKGTGNSSCESPWEQEFRNNTELKSETVTNNKILKDSYYIHDYNENEFYNLKHYDMIFNKEEGTDGDFWLGGRYTVINEEGVIFGLTIIQARIVNNWVRGAAQCYTVRRTSSNWIFTSPNSYH